MKVVCDTSPIISLSSIGKLDILQNLFNEIFVPTAVYNEIKNKVGYGYEEIDYSYIKVQSIKEIQYRDLLLNELDLGEAETPTMSGRKN